MTEVYMEITGAVATARKVGPLTAGMVGVPVMFSFSPEWQELNLLAVFQAGEEKKDNEIKEGRSVIPAQVLTQPGQMLCIGVEGRSKDGALVIPTVWAEVGRILDGAQAANDPALAPTPTQFERFMAGLEQVDEKLRESLRQAKESGAFNGTSVTHRWEGTTLEVTSASGTSRADLKGEPGHTPVKGVDYFTEEDKQEFKEAVCVTCDHITGKCSHTLAQIQELAASGKVVTLKTSDNPEYTYYLQDSESGLFVSLDPGGTGLNYYYASVNREGDVDQHKNQVPVDAVRFYATQLLSEELKARARDNIGAAAAAEAVKTVNGVSPDANGNVQVETSGGSGVEVTAKPGQLIRVKETDEKGNPIAWEAAEDMPWAEVTATEIKAGSYDNNVPFTPVLGEEYIVTYGENIYKCVAKTAMDSDLSFIYIGNASIKNDSLENTGEPWVYFCIMYNGSVVSGALWTDDTAADDTIFIRQSTIHPLAPKFLPEGVPYVENGGGATDTLTFDGNIEGKNAVELGDGMYFVPVSSEYVESAELIGGSVAVVSLSDDVPGGTLSITEEIIQDMSETFGVPAYSISDLVAVLSQDVSMDGITVPKGVVFLCQPGVVYVSELKAPSAVFGGGVTVHKLDPRCLPDNIFTVTADIDTMTADAGSEQIRMAMMQGKTVLLRINHTTGELVMPCIGCHAGLGAFFVNLNTGISGTEISSVNGVTGIAVKPDGSIISG